VIQVSIIKKLKEIEKQRTIVLNDLQSIRFMIRGSYGKSYRRCGKPTCWCAKNNKKNLGHPSYRISWTKNSKSKTKAIPKEDIEWIKEMTLNYRRYRNLRTKLRELDHELKILHDKLEEEVIEMTEKLRDYF